jgi:hypothetical protein
MYAARFARRVHAPNVVSGKGLALALERPWNGLGVGLSVDPTPAAGAWSCLTVASRALCASRAPTTGGTRFSRRVAQVLPRQGRHLDNPAHPPLHVVVLHGPWPKENAGGYSVKGEHLVIGVGRTDKLNPALRQVESHHRTIALLHTGLLLPKERGHVSCGLVQLHVRLKPRLVPASLVLSLFLVATVQGAQPIRQPCACHDANNGGPAGHKCWPNIGQRLPPVRTLGEPTSGYGGLLVVRGCLGRD